MVARASTPAHAAIGALDPGAVRLNPPAAQSRQLHRELDRVGVANQFVELPFADHDYDLSWNCLATQITQHVLGDFLRRQLG